MLLKTAIRLLLFRKAGEQLGLFDVPVPVKPYVRNGKVVPGHVATRKKRLAPKGKQPDLFGAAAPKDETVRLGRLGHFIEKHGGYRRLLSLLESFSPAQKDTLLASMAKLANKTPAAILDMLKTGAKHEAPAHARKDDLFDMAEVPAAGGKVSAEKPESVAGGAQERQIIERHGLPESTQFREGKGVLGLGKWLAAAEGNSTGLHDSKDAAAKALRATLKSRAVHAQEAAQHAEASRALAGRLKAGEKPSFDEWKAVFPGLKPNHTYLRQPEISPFLIEHLGFKRNAIRSRLGRAAGTLTSDTGVNYPIVYFNRLAEVLGGSVPAGEAEPKDGDTKTENGIEYRLQDGRWHRVTPAEAGAYQYGMTYRPPGPGAVPKGQYTVGDHPAFRHGVIQYDRPLTDEEIKQYELTPIGTLDEHARRLIDKMGRYASRYAGNDAALEDFISANQRRVGLWSTDDPGQLLDRVKAKLKGESEPAAEDKSAFQATHELPDGTQVVAHADEANVWVDAQGDEYESEEAYPLSPQDPVRDTAREKLDTAKEAGVITPGEHQAASEALDAEGPAAAKAAIDRKRKADKLRKVAQNLMDKAQAAQNQERNTNTARRARMAQNILARAAHEEATARTMLNLADAIEAGEAPHLEGMNSMAAVQTLDAVLQRARSKYEEVNGWTYDRSKKEQGRPWGEDDIRFVMWPDTTIRKDWIPRLQGDLRQARGGKALADEVRHGNLTQDLYDRMVKVLGEHKVNSHIGWYAADRLKDIARLKRAGITGTEDLQAAVREYVQFKAGRKAIDPVKAAEMALAGQKVGIDFFPTPKALADRMAELADIEPGMKVLEPSAGKGNLADAAKARGADVDVVEVSDALRNVLQTKGYAMVGRDFNDYDPGEVYDRIIMNPPFGNTDRQDAAHIQRAYQMLKPGGKLVSIAGEGVFIGSDQKAVAFRDWLNQRGAMIEKLPDNSFMDRAETHVTGAATRLVVIEKPAGAKQEDEAPRMRTYGWDAVKLSDAYTLKELDALRQRVEREHENPKDANGHPLENGRSTIYLYDKKGRQKLDKIGWAVYYKLDEKRRQEASKPGDAPQEGERNAEGLVFRDGRWRREDSPEARTAAIDDMLDAEEAQRGTLQKAFGLLAA